MKIRFTAVWLILSGSASLLPAATISISKDVRFTVGSQQIIFPNTSAVPTVVASTRDGGRLIGAGLWSDVHTQSGRLLITRLDSAGTNLWTVNIGTNELGETNLVHELTAISETPSGDILVLEFTSRVGNAVTRLVKLRSDGVFVREVNLGGCGGFSTIVADTNGYTLAGTSAAQCFPARYWSTWLLRLSEDFVPQWQKGFFASSDQSTGVIDLKRTADGFIFITRGLNNRTVKVTADGAEEWMTPEGGVTNPYGAPVGVYPVREGGYATLYSSSSAGGHGGADYWIVRINANGQRLWDRFYGGTGNDEPRFLAGTEDGGFIVGGYSQSDSVSGNKGVVGTGTWIVKLDGRGAKEAEFLIPGDYGTILPKATGFSILGPGTSGENVVASVDLNALRRVSVTAKAADARPFNLDTSADLSTWTRLMTGFTGEINFLEAFSGDRKFYRVTEP